MIQIDTTVALIAVYFANQLRNLNLEIMVKNYAPQKQHFNFIFWNMEFSLKYENKQN